MRLLEGCQEQRRFLGIFGTWLNDSKEPGLDRKSVV